MSTATPVAPASQASSEVVLNRSYEGEFTSHDPLDRPAAAAGYFMTQFARDPKLCVAILYLDDHHEPLACDLTNDPNVLSRLSPRSAAAKALDHDASAVIVGYNMQAEGGASVADTRKAFETLRRALDPLDVHVMDFIFCDGDRYRSMLAAGWPQ